MLFVQQHPYNLLARPYPSFDAADAPLVDASVGKGKERATSGLSPSEIRSQLIEWIAEEALSGDLAAAEWVLLACIARV